NRRVAGCLRHLDAVRLWYFHKIRGHRHGPFAQYHALLKVRVAKQGIDCSPCGITKSARINHKVAKPRRSSAPRACLVTEQNEMVGAVHPEITRKPKGS